MANILITAPSLNENVNISGISSLTRTIINNNTVSHKYFHFKLGRKDSEAKNIKWLINQIILLPRFIGFIITNKIDIIHLNTDLTPPSIIRDFQLLIAGTMLFRKKLLLHLHGGYLLMAPPQKKTLLYFLINTMLKRATVRIVLSDIEKAEIHKTYNVNCAVMPNVVEAAENVNDKSFEGKLTLIFMGRIVKSKGIFLIPECLKELSEFFEEINFQIYGTGPDLNDLLTQLNAIEGLNFKYNGVVKGTAKAEAFKKAHIFLLPSIYGEGLPIALLESMNYGCVPVVSNDASIGSVVKAGYNGYLIEKGSYQTLKEGLLKVFSHKSELATMSHRAKTIIHTFYNLENYISVLNQLYDLNNYTNETDQFFRSGVKPYNV